MARLAVTIPGYVGAVQRIDPDTGEVLAELSEIDIPARIAVDFGSVWIRDSGSSNVYRVGAAPIAAR